MIRIWLVSLFSCLVSGVASAVCPWQHVGDVADLGRHPGRGDDERRRAAGHLGVHERHVDAVAERGLRRDGVDALRDRRALARQGRLVDLERRRADDPAVRRDEVARLDVDDVARDESSMATIDDLAARRTFAWTTIIFWSAATLASALPSWLRPRKALKTVSRISRTPVANWPGRNRLTMPATSRTICIGSRVLAQERLPARLLGRLRELVRADVGAPGRDLGVGQPGLLRGRFWAAERLVRRHRVPGAAVRPLSSRVGCGHVRTTSTSPPRRSVRGGRAMDSTAMHRIARITNRGHTNLSHVP